MPQASPDMHLLPCLILTVVAQAEQGAQLSTVTAALSIVHVLHAQCPGASTHTGRLLLVQHALQLQLAQAHMASLCHRRMARPLCWLGQLSALMQVRLADQTSFWPTEGQAYHSCVEAACGTDLTCTVEVFSVQPTGGIRFWTRFACQQNLEALNAS